MQIRAFDQINSFGSKSMDIGGGIHPYYELLFIYKGEANIQWIGKNYNISAPALLLFPPSTPHWVTKISTKFSCWFIELSINDTNSVPNIHAISLWNKLQSILVTPSSELAAITIGLESITLTLEQRMKNRESLIWGHILKYDVLKIFALIQHYVDSLISYNITQENQTPINFNQMNILEKEIEILTRYLESFYASRITLQSLSDQIHLSPSYVIRLFKEKSGLTPFQYLNELRMNAACCYLKATDLSIQDIAEEVGFSSIHYFSRIFKQNLGESPTNWREKNKIYADKYHTVIDSI